MAEPEAHGHEDARAAGDPADEPEGPDPWEPVQAFVVAHWEYFATPVVLVLSVGFYWVLAATLPVGALFLSSIAMVAAFTLVILIVVPMDSYITWSRRLEVLAYRVFAGLSFYLLAGVGIFIVLNTMFPSPVVPMSWPLVGRYLPFWPFYSFAVVGCNWVEAWPCPPPPG